MDAIKHNKALSLNSLSIEITRRCNMNCDFCSRGQAQNIDITPAIIDKTLDEVKNCYIHTLRLNGGEPFLNANMIEYLVNSIIDKQIIIGNLCVFTNGTIKSEIIKHSLNRLLLYLQDIKAMDNCYMQLLKDELNLINVNNYKVSENNKITIIVSDWQHDSNLYIDDFIRFYNINTSICEIIKQTETLISNDKTIYLSGNTLINHRKILNDNVNIFKDVRTLINEYNFIKENSNILHIGKTLTVSANGNVFVGCLQSYDKVDNKPVFNILDCNNNFIDSVYNWCWSHPLTAEMNKIKEIEASKKWLLNNGYSLLNSEKPSILCRNDYLTNGFESTMKKVHNQYKFLTLTEAEEMAIYLVCLTYLELQQIKPYYYLNKYLYAFLNVNFLQFTKGLEYVFNDYTNKLWLEFKINKLIGITNQEQAYKTTLKISIL